MLRWFPRIQLATTCFSCSPPDLNLLVSNFIFCIHVKQPLPPNCSKWILLLLLYTIYYLLYTISFLSKVPANEPTPGSPAGPLRREIVVYGAFCMSLYKNVIKMPLIRKPQERNAHPCSPKVGPLRKQTPISEP